MNPNRTPETRRGWGTRECFCFWAVVGKTINMKKHLLMGDNMGYLEKKKQANKYQEIDESRLLDMWPSFREDLSNRYIFYMLSDSI